MFASSFSLVFFLVPAATIRIAQRKSYANISEECHSLRGPKDKVCPEIIEWHETIKLDSGSVDLMCEPILAWTAKNTCTTWCEKAGYDCLRGQDQKEKTCTLDRKHTRKSTANNGCEQSWTNQICQCGKKHTDPVVLPDFREGGSDGEPVLSEDDEVLEEVDADEEGSDGSTEVSEEDTPVDTSEAGSASSKASVGKRITAIVPYNPGLFPKISNEDTRSSTGSSTTTSSSMSTSMTSSTQEEEDEHNDPVAAPDSRVGEVDGESVSSDYDEELEEIDRSEDVATDGTLVGTSETEPPISEASVEIDVGRDEFMALKRSERWARVEDIEAKLVEPFKAKIVAAWDVIRAENGTLNNESRMIKALQKEHDKKRKAYLKRISKVKKEYRKLQGMKKKVYELRKFANY